MRRWIAAGFCFLSAVAHAQTGGDAMGTLVVAVEPAGAAVLVDGELLGQTPATLRVPAGAHDLRVALNGYTAFEQAVTVTAGETLRIEAVLEQRPSVISVRALPANATATVNGIPARTAQPVPTGRVDVVVSRPGYPDLQTVLTIGPDTETTVTYDESGVRPGRSFLAVAAPGILQVRDGRAGVGALYTTAVYGGLATVIATTVAAHRANSDLGPTLEEYEAADNEPDAVDAREELEHLTSVVRTSQRLRVGAAVVAGAVYVVSLVDSFTRNAHRPTLITTTARNPFVSAVVSGEGIGIAFSL